MSEYFNEYDKKIFKTMNNYEWRIDQQKERKIDLLEIANKINKESSISDKIGGLLIWQQVIEQMLKEIICTSITYIKAEIWPTKVNYNVKFNDKTFVKIISDYDLYSLDYEAKDKIVQKLKTINNNRNTIIHKIFDIENLNKLEDLFEINFSSYNEIMLLLLNHYLKIYDCLEDLSKRVNWNNFI